MRVMEVVAAGSSLAGYKGFSKSLNSERLSVQASVCCVGLKRRQVQALRFGGFQSQDLRCLRGIVPLSVATVQVEPSSEVKASPSAQDILDWNLEGWKVVLDETGEAVGRVEEVLSLASYWDPSVVEYCLLRVFDSSSPGVEYLIPEDLQNVDTEIETFLGECWREETNADTGKTVIDKPPAASITSPTPVSQDWDDYGTAMMPRAMTLRRMGRYDLHNAIMMHGGYKEVAQQLGRMMVYGRREVVDLESEIREFMRRHKLSLFPKPAELLAEKRDDLLAAVREQGGVVAVARRMGLRPQRNGVSPTADVSHALFLQRYLLPENEAVETGELRLPEQADILQDGRRDLRYALQKYGQEAIAEILGIKNLTMRRPRIPRP